MSSIMREDWIEVELGELSLLELGGDWGKDPNIEDNEYLEAYCIRGSEFRNWENDKGKTASLRKIKKDSIEKRNLFLDDILVEISGGGPEQPVGRTVVIEHSVLNHFKDKNLVCTNFLRLIRPSVFVNSIYLNHYLKYFYSTGKIIPYQSGSNNLRNLKFNDYLTIEIPFSPLPIQRAIVSKIEALFSDLDNGIANFKKAQEQLKIYRQAVLKKAFEGGFTNENIIEGELPIGWEWKRISEISNVVRGGSPRPAGDPKFYDGNIPFLKVRDITKDNGKYLNTFEYTIKEAGLHKTRQIKPNTLLLSNSGATLGVPKICMIDATMNDGIAAFLNLDERSNLFLYYFWESKTKELRNINMGAAQPNLNTDIIKNYLVPYCSFDEQSQIVAEIESRLSVCDKMEQSITESIEKAEALRQSILKKAFEGKLLSQAEIELCKTAADYEPASELLKKIQAEKLAKELEKKKPTVKKKRKK
jgi:type I restriction enzyme, S subunit